MSFIGKAWRYIPVIAVAGLLSACGSHQAQITDDMHAAPGSVEEFETTIGSTVQFALDSSNIPAEGQDILSRQATFLQYYPYYHIVIEGHADERGTREYNLALGQRRAVAVRNFLVAQGVPAANIRTVSYGKERPVATCDDESCWSQNRRTVTVLEKS